MNLLDEKTINQTATNLDQCVYLVLHSSTKRRAQFIDVLDADSTNLQQIKTTFDKSYLARMVTKFQLTRIHEKERELLQGLRVVNERVVTLVNLER